MLPDEDKGLGVLVDSVCSPDHTDTFMVRLVPFYKETKGVSFFLPHEDAARRKPFAGLEKGPFQEPHKWAP